MRRTKSRRPGCDSSALTIDRRLLWRRHRLPEIEPVYDDGGKIANVELRRLGADQGTPRALYRLLWPGQIPGQISGEISIGLRKEAALEAMYDTTLIWPVRRDMPKGIVSGLQTIGSVLPFLPDMVPEDLAYWLAVNHDALPEGSVRPVCGLPAQYAVQAVRAAMVLDHDALLALGQLAHLAEDLWENPIGRYFDTVVRDDLLAIPIEATYCYFRLLGDYLFDEKSSWFDHTTGVNWPEKATYLFWVGRTGRGLYLPNSKFGETQDATFARQHQKWSESCRGAVYKRGGKAKIGA